MLDESKVTSVEDNSPRLQRQLLEDAPRGMSLEGKEATMTGSESEDWYTGNSRPPQIPDDWEGEPLPDGRGWRWFNPANRGDSVRLYRGDPDSEFPHKREPYVIVTRNGQLIDHKGQPTGEFLAD